MKIHNTNQRIRIWHAIDYEYESLLATIDGGLLTIFPTQTHEEFRLRGQNENIAQAFRYPNALL